MEGVERQETYSTMVLPLPVSMFDRHKRYAQERSSQVSIEIRHAVRMRSRMEAIRDNTNTQPEVLTADEAEYLISMNLLDSQVKLDDVESEGEVQIVVIDLPPGILASLGQTASAEGFENVPDYVEACMLLYETAWDTI